MFNFDHLYLGVVINETEPMKELDCTSTGLASLLGAASWSHKGLGSHFLIVWKLACLKRRIFVRFIRLLVNPHFEYAIQTTCYHLQKAVDHYKASQHARRTLSMACVLRRLVYSLSNTAGGERTSWLLSSIYKGWYDFPFGSFFLRGTLSNLHRH